MLPFGHPIYRVRPKWVTERVLGLGGTEATAKRGPPAYFLLAGRSPAVAGRVSRIPGRIRSLAWRSPAVTRGRAAVTRGRAAVAGGAAVVAGGAAVVAGRVAALGRWCPGVASCASDVPGRTFTFARGGSAVTAWDSSGRLGLLGLLSVLAALSVRGRIPDDRGSRA